MSVDAALRAGRAAAERLMVDTGAAKRATGETVQDPDTFAEVPEFADLFTSRCKVQARNLVAREEDAAGRTATSVRLELHLPLSAAPLDVDDVWTMTAVGALSDVALLGRSFRIVAPVAKTYATARRYEVEEVVS